MNLIQNIILTCFLLVPYIIIAQSNNDQSAHQYSDMVLVDGEYYLMNPSPSKDYSSSNNIWCGCDAFYRGVYEVKNDSLYFVKVLGVSTEVNKRYRDSISFPATGTFIPTNDDYKLLAVRNAEDIGRRLKTDFIYYQAYWGQNQTELNVKNGVVQKEYFLQDSSESFEEFGKLNIIFYNTKDKIDPKIIRVSDAKVVGRFDAEEHENSYFQDRNIYSPGEEVDLEVEHNSYSGDYNVKLPEGKYIVDFSSKKSEFYSDTIEIKVGSQVQVTFNPGNAYISNNDYYEATYNEPYFNGYIYDFVYGNNGLIESGNHQVNMFSIGIQGSNELFLGSQNRASIVGSFGGRYGAGLIHPDSSVIGLDDFTFQNYSYLSLEGSATARLYAGKYQQKRDARLFLEAGLSYKLPIIFRYVARFDTQKHTDRWMHQFTDLAAIARLGLHNGVSLKAEYRPFNVIKSPFPQLPKLSIGLSITFYEMYSHNDYNRMW
jgi:hypothetical protein